MIYLEGQYIIPEEDWLLVLSFLIEWKIARRDAAHSEAYARKQLQSRLDHVKKGEISESTMWHCIRLGLPINKIGLVGWSTGISPWRILWRFPHGCTIDPLLFYDPKLKCVTQFEVDNGTVVARDNLLAHGWIAASVEKRCIKDIA